MQQPVLKSYSSNIHVVKPGLELLIALDVVIVTISELTSVLELAVVLEPIAVLELTVLVNTYATTRILVVARPICRANASSNA